MKEDIMTNEIKAIIFDAYGTLFNLNSLNKLILKIYPDKGLELAKIWRDKQLEYTRLRSLSDQYVNFWKVTKDALEFACDALGLKLTSFDKERLMDSYLKLNIYPEIRKVLTSLKNNDMTLAILSNGNEMMIGEAVENASIKEFFQHILSVNAVQKFKTAPEAYQLGLDAFNCNTKEIIFVSSNSWDICGATWFGYNTFWVNRENNSLDRLGVEPTWEGNSLHDLLKIIEQHQL